MNFTKIVVTFSGYNADAINDEIKAALNHINDFDIVEIRGDGFDALNRQDHINIVENIINTFKPKEKEIIYTYRTASQGGKGSKTTVEYQALLQGICQMMDIDYIDIEVKIGKDIVKEIKEVADDHHIKVLLSHHDFKKTDSKEEIETLFKDMDNLKGDVFKFAYMPQSKEDVLRVTSMVEKAKEQYGNKIVGISMGELGKKTRLEKASVFTYGFISRDAAPGQIHITELRKQFPIKDD